MSKALFAAYAIELTYVIGGAAMVKILTTSLLPFGSTKVWSRQGASVLGVFRLVWLDAVSFQESRETDDIKAHTRSRRLLFSLSATPLLI